MARTWREIRRQKPLSEARVDTYRRLMDAETRLDEVRRRRGVGEEAVAAALEINEPDSPDAEPEEEAYLATLARYVALLGGRLELLAVFPEETVTLLRDPDPARPAADVG
jgi:hypothetical protein